MYRELMEKHIEKLLEFAKANNPESIIASCSKMDADIRSEWENAKSDYTWRKIKSSQDVLDLIQFFENNVATAPKDIRSRNLCKPEMLIAQYKVMRGLEKWCNSISGVSLLKDTNYAQLSESEVDDLITRIKNIMDRI